MNTLLTAVSPQNKQLLSLLLQEYLAETAIFYGDRPDENGRYPYPYLDLYFSDPERKAYFIASADAPAGFVLINRFSVFGDDVDWSVAEFYIRPAFRRQGLGRSVMEEIFRRHKGRWELVFSLENNAAEAFWRSVTAPFSPSGILWNSQAVLSFPVP